MPVVHIISGDGKRDTLTAPAGTNLLELLQGYRAGHPAAPCGGKGTCHKCRVRLISGLAFCPASDSDRKAFSTQQLLDGWRLACRVTLAQDSEIFLEYAGHKVAESCETALSGRIPVLSHSLHRFTVELSAPDINNQTPDNTRLLCAITEKFTGNNNEPCPAPLNLSLSALRDLPDLLRENQYRIDVIISGNEVIALRPPQSGRLLGAAIDLGTTTVALSLYDMADGELLGTASSGNMQSQFGDDVICRITASKNPDGLAKLQDAAQQTICQLVKQACAESSQNKDDIFSYTIAGNTVMQHLFAGIPPANIGCSPFTPVFTQGLPLQSSDMLPSLYTPQERNAAEFSAPVYLLPSLGPYVGADITAGIVSQMQMLKSGNILMVDAGTNGEIVLHSKGKITVCATAAGPAFEGARISCGMRACGGAISAISLTPTQNGGNPSLCSETEFSLTTINNETPVGLCGSGLLDAVATFLEAGLIDETGALADDDGLADDYPQKLRVLLCDEGVKLAKDVMLSGRDIREFQLACAAIHAGCRVLIEIAGLTPEKLDGVLLAGGFGSRLSVKSALRTGLIPPGVSPSKVHSIGNSSLAGARLALLQESIRNEAEDLRLEVECIELSGRADFQEFYLNAMEFPEA